LRNWLPRFGHGSQARKGSKIACQSPQDRLRSWRDREMYRLENRIKVTWFIGFELTNQVLGKVRGRRRTFASLPQRTYRVTQFYWTVGGGVNHGQRLLARIAYPPTYSPLALSRLFIKRHGDGARVLAAWPLSVLPLV
jgi:hypothetical protein